MYGIVLGYLTTNNALFLFDLWSAKITLTPILFVAFWSLAGTYLTYDSSISRLYSRSRSFRSMDQNDHRSGTNPATGRSDRRYPPHHGCHSFRIPSDRWSGRVSGQFERRGGDGRRSKFRDRTERDRAAKALQGQVAVGADAEEHSRFHWLHDRAGTHALLTRGDRTEEWYPANDDRFHSLHLGYADLALPATAASISLQVKGRDIFVPSPDLNLHENTRLHLQQSCLMKILEMEEYISIVQFLVFL